MYCISRGKLRQGVIWTKSHFREATFYGDTYVVKLCELMFQRSLLGKGGIACTYSKTYAVIYIHYKLQKFYYWTGSVVIKWILPRRRGYDTQVFNSKLSRVGSKRSFSFDIKKFHNKFRTSNKTKTNKGLVHDRPNYIYSLFKLELGYNDL